MRLWHQDLIPYLDRQRLLGQHRECCALRGRGWMRKHATVDYVFNYGLDHLYMYHCIVMKEMSRRGYKANFDWYGRLYRGAALPRSSLLEVGSYVWNFDGGTIYPEHDNEYLAECILLLKAKNAKLEKQDELDAILFKLSVEIPDVVNRIEERLNIR